MGELNICFSTDNNYAEQLAVTIASIIKNSNDSDSFNFFILNSDFSKENKSKIEELKHIKDFKIAFIKINKNDFSCCPMLKDYNDEFSHYHVTQPTYYRFKLASIFPNLTKILYLDCDLIIKSSLEDLYSIDISDYYAAMIPDVENENESERLGLDVYCNAGVMLINLDKWRKDDIENRLFDYASKNKETILWQDQDIMNVVFKDKIYALNRKWNFQYFLYDETRYEGLLDKYYKYNILHFAGKYKPWGFHIVHPLFFEYYNYLALTPWKTNILKYQQKEIEAGVEQKYLEYKNQVIDELTTVINQLKEALDERQNANQKEFKHVFGDLNKLWAEKNDEVQHIFKDIKSLWAEKNDEISRVFQNTEEKFTALKDLYDDIDIRLNKINSEYDGKYQEKINELDEKTSKITNQIFEDISKLWNEKNNEVSALNSDILKINEKLTQLAILSQNLKKIDDIHTQIHNIYGRIDNNDDKLVHINNKLNSLEDEKNKISDHIFGDINKLWQEKNSDIDNLYRYINEKSDGINSYINDIHSKMNNIDFEIRQEISNRSEQYSRLVETKGYNLQKEIENMFLQKFNEVISKNQTAFEQQNNLYSQCIESQQKFEKTILDNKIEEYKKTYEELLEFKLTELNNEHIAELSQYKEIIQNYQNQMENLQKSNEELLKNFLQVQSKFENELINQQNYYLSKLEPVKDLISFCEKKNKIMNNIKKAVGIRK